LYNYYPPFASLILYSQETPHPIIDQCDRIIGTLVGQPHDPSWSDVEKDASKSHPRCQRECFIQSKAVRHRRGNFAGLITGVSFGGSQKVSAEYCHQWKTTNESQAQETSKTALSIPPSSHHSSLILLFNAWLDLLHVSYFMVILSVSNPFIFQRLSAYFAPRLFHYYRKELGTLFTSNSSLHITSLGVLACHHLQLWPIYNHLPPYRSGQPVFWVVLHYCLSPFDPHRGGHLILWDLGLVIDFPPGSTILIPSALVRHSNTVIQPGEECYSLTHYAAGGLFCYVSNGLCSDKTFMKEATEAELKQWRRIVSKRWSDVWAFSKVV